MTSNKGAVYVITGASRGLGLEFVRQLLAADAQHTVVAAVRNSSSAPQLDALDDGSGRLHIVQLDVADEASIKTAAQTITQRFGHVDVLINNAGLLEKATQLWDDINVPEFRTIIDANVLGPLLVTAALLPALQQGSRKLVANISSSMGSITHQAEGLGTVAQEGGVRPRAQTNMATSYVGYRASKAALNMVTATTARDLAPEGFTVVAIHPGWVATDMGNSAAGSGSVRPPLTAEQSVSGVLNVLSSLTPADTGSFRSYDGAVLPW